MLNYLRVKSTLNKFQFQFQSYLWERHGDRLCHLEATRAQREYMLFEHITNIDDTYHQLRRTINPQPNEGRAKVLSGGKHFCEGGKTFSPSRKHTFFQTKLWAGLSIENTPQKCMTAGVAKIQSGLMAPPELRSDNELGTHSPE